MKLINPLGQVASLQCREAKDNTNLQVLDYLALH